VLLAAKALAQPEAVSEWGNTMRRRI